MDPNARTRLSEQPVDPFVGRTFGGYRVEGVIGRGGMGTVYMARQLSLGRPVAIKVLPKDLAREEQFLERFHREADALSRLSHPGIVAVFDRGEIDGQPYLVMEYVEGTSLREAMRGGPLPLAETLRVTAAVLAALDHAHEKGIVHRDVKPENILLSGDGAVKVADFGLSRLLGPDDATRLTRTQLVLGTYEYMAPEQREHAREADPRSDLYAVGVVLYEMLAGELPIGRFAMPSRRRPEDCDARVDALVEKSLEKNPADRFTSAREMGDAVEAIRKSPQPRPAPASPHAPPGYRPVRFEHHLDNVATIDHVLGTVAYVLGFVALFGGMAVGTPFFVIFFIGGWYLRQTAEGLRKYRAAARTAQAVIAILAACTGILLPLSIYSFWVLFSHRGRTYYDARGRGLDEHAAARHTYRVLEEPYTPAPARPAVPPRPSAIPVQSMVTSEVREEPFVPRRSRLVSAGFWILLLTIVAGALLVGAALAEPSLRITDEAGVTVAFGLVLAGGLFALGFLRAIFSARTSGAGAAFVGLFLCGILGAGTFVLVGRSTTPPHSNIVSFGPAEANERYLGRLRTTVPASFDRDFFRENDRLERIARLVEEPIPALRLVRRSGNSLYVQYPPDAKNPRRIALAVQRLVEEALDGDFESYVLDPAPDDWDFLSRLR
ncbi:MAG TPA: serine/threonine-protein kinase [Planctomycetota bacterium]|nr:serine/threonine-protein kinase [Planctomycetota bacterium]